MRIAPRARVPPTSSPTGGPSGRRRKLRATQSRRTRQPSRRRSVTTTSWQRPERIGITARHPGPIRSMSHTPRHGSAPSNGRTTSPPTRRAEGDHRSRNGRNMFEAVEATATEAAERAVIGAALADKSANRWASEHITDEDFSSARLGAVWHTLYARWKAGEPTDPVAMDGALRGAVQGYTPGAVFDLMDAAPVTGATGYWAAQIAEGSKRRGAIAAGTRLIQGATTGDLAEALTTIKGDLEEIGKAATSRIEARSLARILEESDEYDWVIPGILERRDRVIFTGGEGAGKSTLVRQMAILSAAGINPLTFEDMDPARVLIVDAENTEKQWRRATRDIVGKASHAFGANVAELIPLACVPSLDITKERDLSAVHDLIDRHEPAIVFIGPLYKLVPRAIQSDDDAAPLIKALDSIRARDVALVMEAHA